MQEEVNGKTIALSINGAKLTGRTLKWAIQQFLKHRSRAKEKKYGNGVHHRGKQTVKQLVGQDQGVQNIEINDKNIKDFDRVARKYGIDYAVKKDTMADKPRYLVFFKARDGDALNAAFREYSAKTMKKQMKPSIVQKLRAAIPTQTKAKVRKKNKEKEL